MKSKLFIKHDVYASIDSKMKKLLKNFHEAGYGVWWCIVEQLTQSDEHILEKSELIDNVSYALFTKKQAEISKIINFCIEIGLLIEDGENIYNDRIIRQCIASDEKSRKYTENAKSRWNKEKEEKGEAIEDSSLENNKNAKAMPLDMQLQCNGSAKNFLDKDKEQDKDLKQEGEEDAVSFVVSSYNELCKGKFNEIKVISETRKSHCRALYYKFGADTIREVFAKASNSSFLNGDNKRGWKATFDWLILPSNFIKILEDSYKDKTPAKQMPKSSVASKEDFAGQKNANGGFDL